MCILIMNHLVLFCFVFILMGKTEVFFFLDRLHRVVERALDLELRFNCGPGSTLTPYRGYH